MTPHGRQKDLSTTVPVESATHLEAQYRDKTIAQIHCLVDLRRGDHGNSEIPTQRIETGFGRVDGPRIMEVASRYELLDLAANGRFGLGWLCLHRAMGTRD